MGEKDNIDLLIEDARHDEIIAQLELLVAAAKKETGGMGHGANYDIVKTDEDRYREKIIKEDEEWLKIIKKYMDYRIKN